MCLNLGGNILASTTEIKLVVSSHCNAGEPVWISKASMYLQIALFFLTALQIHLIYPPVESEATSY